jgi:pimeloyl-ACP methyl ester carboxylesterase
MLLYRYAPERLLVHSAVALDPAGMQQLEALGTPGVILVPNRMHRLQAPAYAERYPEARVVCPAAVRDHVAKVVSVQATVEEVLPELGGRCHAPPGVKPGELVYELPLEGGVALAFTDLLFNLPYQRGVSGWLTRLIGSSGFFGVTRVGRMLLVDDRRALAAWLREQAAREDLRLISVAHGERVGAACGQRLREAAGRLAPA